MGIPEAEVGVLPDVLGGMDVIEPGGGTGYMSGWMWRRGARVMGVDVSSAQLATARRLAEDTGRGEALRSRRRGLPLGGASLDFAISEYGPTGGRRRGPG